VLDKNKIQKRVFFGVEGVGEDAWFTFSRNINCHNANVCVTKIPIQALKVSFKSPSSVMSMQKVMEPMI